MRRAECAQLHSPKNTPETLRSISGVQREDAQTGGGPVSTQDRPGACPNRKGRTRTESPKELA